MKNQVYTLECTELSSQGLGVCKCEGIVVFMKDLLPQEMAKVKIVKQNKNFCFGIVLELLKKSEFRIESDCKVFGKCGGCDLRHLNYLKQLEYKRQSIYNFFKYQHQIDLDIKEVVACEIKSYRNKILLPIKDGNIGFYRKNSHDIINHDGCVCHGTLTNEIVNYFKQIFDDKKGIFRHLFIRHFESTNEVMLGFIVYQDKRQYLMHLAHKMVEKFPEIKSIILNVNKRNDNCIINYEFKDQVLYGRNYILDQFETLTYQVTFKSFYQVNSLMMRKLYHKVKQLVPENSVCLDVYSGIGSIAMHVSSKAKQVLGIEIIEDAVMIANQNKMINQLDNVEFQCIDAKNLGANYFKDIDCVILDPPRKGLESNIIDILNNSSIKQIIYVSCNYVTFVRDFKLLQHNYELKEFYIYDLFRDTNHAETIALLCRK